MFQVFSLVEERTLNGSGMNQAKAASMHSELELTRETKSVKIRNKVLRAFEQAETEEDVNRHRDLLTFVLIGGGPTGVEMAAAIAVLVRNALRSEFRRIDPSPRVLSCSTQHRDSRPLFG